MYQRASIRLLPYIIPPNSIFSTIEIRDIYFYTFDAGQDCLWMPPGKGLALALALKYLSNMLGIVFVLVTQ